VADLNKNPLIKDLKILTEHYQAEFLKYIKLQYPEIINKNKAYLSSFLKNYYTEENSFKIADVTIKNPVVSAPLAGISDNTYRVFSRAFGSALNYTEMVSSYGLYYNHKESIALINISEFERPCAVQIFGSDPGVMLDAAYKIQSRADMIDINMGCPVLKVIKTKSGGYLLNDEQRVRKIIKKIISNIEKPLTIKVRLGWDKNSINVMRIAQIAEDEGVSAIAIHGRTVRQGFAGDVDYRTVKEVKESIKIPVIVSGDIDCYKRARNILEFTGCDGVMIGRASRGSPWLFFNIVVGFLLQNLVKKHHKNGKEHPVFYDSFFPPLIWKKEFAILYLRFLIYFKGEEKSVKEYRKFLAWIFKGTRGIGNLKKDFFSIETLNDAIAIINSI
jgi:tRNA-dihydrouridine synthase B